MVALSTAWGRVGDLSVFLAAYYLVAVLHEAMHVLAACFVGKARSALTLTNARSALLSRHVRVPGVSGWRAEVVRHSGWLVSALLALAISKRRSRPRCRSPDNWRSQRRPEGACPGNPSP